MPAQRSVTRLHAVGRPMEPRRRSLAPPRIVVLIPCFNEEAAVGRVVADFRTALPDAVVYVYDNNSTDRTAELAGAAGAVVRHERRQGKGHVVRRMFADVDADIYLLVDGDDTYDAAAAPRLVERLMSESLDMVNAARVGDDALTYRPGHRLGNRMLAAFVAAAFGRECRDLLSGYRVLSRRFVKSFPALSTGFEIETELTVHALGLHMPMAEIETAYRSRGEGSRSKLNTLRDGARILWLILVLIKEERPLAFFLTIAAMLAFASLYLAVPIFLTYAATGLVPRLPTAILSTGLMILASLSVVCGMVLETVTRGRQEIKRLHYLVLTAPPDTSEGA